MTTMTINPGVRVTPSTGSRLAFLRQLLRAAKTRAMDLIRLGLAYVGKATTAVRAFVPAPILSLVGPVVLATKTGYHAALNVVSLAIQGTFKGASWLARMTRKAIGWAGDRIVDLVAMFSLDASCKVADAFARFGDYVGVLGKLAESALTGAATSVKDAALSVTTVRTTTITSGAIAAGIVSSHFAPAMTYATLSSVPLVGKWLILAVSGGWVSLAVIAGVAMVSTGFVLGAKVLADYRTERAAKAAAEPTTETEAPQAEAKVLVPDAVLTEDEARAEVARLEREMKAPIGSSPNKKHPKRK